MCKDDYCSAFGDSEGVTYALQSQGPSKGDAATVNKLRLQIVQLEDVVSHMADTQASFVSSGTGTSLPFQNSDNSGTMVLCGLLADGPIT